MDEKNLLKSALSEALGQKEQVQMQYGQLQREHAQLVHEDNSLKNQVGVQACEDEGHRVGGPGREGGTGYESSGGREAQGGSVWEGGTG